MLKFFRGLFGSKHEKDVRLLQPYIAEINKFAEGLESLSDEQLKGKTDEFRERIKAANKDLEDGIVAERESLKNPDLSFEAREEVYNRIDALHKELDQRIQQTLDSLLPEAFAVVKETCRRLVDQMWMSPAEKSNGTWCRLTFN